MTHYLEFVKNKRIFWTVEDACPYKNKVIANIVLSANLT